MDWKATFDNVERETLWRILEGKDMKRRMIERVRKIYEETIVTIRAGEGVTDKF